MVNASDRPGWEEYAIENQEWVQQGYSFQGMNVVADPIPRELHNQTLGSPIPADAPGPFSPVWQMSPAPNDTSIINFDLRSNLVYQGLEARVTETSSWAISSIISTSTLFGSAAPNTFGSPQSVMLLPIFSDLSADSSRRVTATLNAVLVWELYLEGLLPSGVDGLVVVLGDSSGYGASFELYGPNVTFLGNYDLHDPAYSDIIVSTPIACFPVRSVVEIDTANGEVLATQCDISLYIYPSSTFQAAYRTNKPAIYCSVVVMVVVFTAVTFMFFDWYTRIQEDKLIIKAERTHALVASLFPENLHDRLLNTGKNKEEEKVKLAGTAGLRMYLNNGEVKGEDLDPETKPIADL